MVAGVRHMRDHILDPQVQETYMGAHKNITRIAYWISAGMITIAENSTVVMALAIRMANAH